MLATPPNTNDKPMIVFCTHPDAEQAKALGKHLLAEKLAACVQLLPPMTSLYVWDGDVQEDSETLMLIKSHQHLWPMLEQTIGARHPYDVPQLIAISAVEIHEPYRSWLMEHTLSAKASS